MKRLLILLSVTLLSSSIQLFACEICGCGVGNFYLGMMPNFTNKFIGIRYRSLYYRTQANNDPSQFSNDNYETIEIWNGWNLGKKWQLITFIPFQINQRITDDGTKTNTGIGDITVLANYKIWNYEESLVMHQLWIGGGAKLPTGQYKIDFSDPTYNLGDPNGQTGTGSLDYLLNVNHALTYLKWGVNTTVNYKINTANSDQFKFGDRVTANMMLFHRFVFNSFKVAPTVGGLYEHLKSNAYQNIEITATGGYAALGSLGVETSYRKIAFGLSFQHPLSQNYSQYQTIAKDRVLTHLTFTF
jgi:hypothetical protein